MGMAEQVILGLNFKHSVPQWGISPMNANSLVKNHDWRFMRDQHVNIVGDERFSMVIR